MQDDHIHCVDDTNQIVLPWQSVSAEAAMPYLKAIALVIMLLASWVGLCSV